jgi:hypothetical protein
MDHGLATKTVCVANQMNESVGVWIPMCQSLSRLPDCD